MVIFDMIYFSATGMISVSIVSHYGIIFDIEPVCPWQRKG